LPAVPDRWDGFAFLERRDRPPEALPGASMITGHRKITRPFLYEAKDFRLAFIAQIKFF